MRLRLLFTLGLIVFMTTMASSNECYRYRRTAEGKAECEAAGQSATPAQSLKGEYSTTLVSKLLYI